MFGQPRCREWTPLATQQLRLRSLLQIVGYNLYGSDGTSSAPGSLYYTLHVTQMSAPFYTSEKLLSYHPKWREIDSELIHKMSSRSVVVRVWKHIRCADKPNKPDPSNANRKMDEIIQTWSVNFSGLLHIGANLNLDFSAKSFKDNTLIFQMSGGYFSSYDKLVLQCIPKRLLIHPTCSTAKRKEESSKVIPIDIKKKGGKESKSASPSKFSWKNELFDGKLTLSKSQSPPKGDNLKIRVANVQTGRAYHDSSRDRTHFDPELAHEHSPKSDSAGEIREYSGSEGSGDHFKSSGSRSASNRDLSNVDESEPAEVCDSNLTPIPKYRFVNMNFLASEIRPSYNAEKLIKLHQLQFSIKNRLQAVQQLKEKIYQKSPLENCDNLSPLDSCADYESFSRSEDLSVSCREYSLLTNKSKVVKSKIFSEDDDISNHIPPKTEDKIEPGKTDSAESELRTDRRFTIKLNKLLDIKAQPTLSQRLRIASLTKQLELSRFRRRLLQDERDAKLAKIREMKEKIAKLSEENLDQGSDLMQKYHSLSKKWDQLKELHKSEAALNELCVRSNALLQARRWSLVQDIQLVYPITENSEGNLCLLGIHLPACQSAEDGLRQVPEEDLAVVLGYVAHAVALAASFLNVPLRHPLKLMGSRTKIVNQLAPNQEEIPLFARNKDSAMFRYGLFFLNRNIVQLLWATQRYITPNPRDTLANLKKLMTPPPISYDLETSRTFGSASSIETACAAGHSLAHPISTPILNAEGADNFQSISPSNQDLSAFKIRKASHNSLRSLVAIGTDRTARNIVSGGFNNMGNRQFNRFKDCIDGQSPKAAMVIRKRRYSHSVENYVTDQAYSMSPTVIGSEPSLLIHDNHGDVHASENDLSDSPSENAENAMSHSESDLTKVSDLTSPEVNGTRVVFSIGDDSLLSDSEKEPRERQSAKEKLPEVVASDKETKKIQNEEPPRDSSARLSKENVEIQNLHLDVDQLTKELNQMCSNYDKVPIEEKCDASISENRDANRKSGEIEYFSPGEEIKASVKPEIIVSTNDPNQIKLVRKCKGRIVDIEKLDCLAYCDEPCSKNCTKAIEKLMENINVDVQSEQDISDDVIVLPSAEAILPGSSHFTDSLRLSDEATEAKETPDTSEFSENTDRNDSECICEGKTASKDANDLLENIKLIEEADLDLIEENPEENVANDDFDVR